MDVFGWFVAAGSSLLTAVLYPFILHRLKKMDDKRDQAQEERRKEKEMELAQIQANSEGIKLILRYMLERYHAEYMIQEFVTPDQRRLYRDIYEAYEGLHGNGEGTKMEEEIMELPVRTDVHPVNPFVTLLKKQPEAKEEES